MNRAILSMPRFTFGVITLAIGLAVVVAELTSMRFDETGSVAGLAGGVVVLVAATLAPRRSKHDVVTTEPVRRIDGEPWIDQGPIWASDDVSPLGEEPAVEPLVDNGIASGDEPATDSDVEPGEDVTK